MEKNWHSQNMDFLSLKKMLNFSYCWKSEVWKQNCMQLFYFNFEKNYVLKSRSPCILLNKNVNFNRNKQNRKWKIPHSVLERRTLCLSICKNHKFKVKLWWVGACERKKRAFFVPFILSKGIFFFNVYVSSQCIVYWIHFQNIRTFTYQKTLLHTLLLLVFKIVESL